MVEVTVFDYNNKLIENARVTLEVREQEGRQIFNLKFDPVRGSYVSPDVPAGLYLLKVEAKGYAPDDREVRVDPAGLQTIVILGTPGMPFLYRGEVKNPFQPLPEMIAVVLEPKTATKEVERILAAARNLNLAQVETGEQVRRQQVYVFRFAPNISDADKERISQELLGLGVVTTVGALIRFDKESLSLLTNELVVKFKSHVVIDEVPEIAKRFNMETLRRLPQAGNAFLFRMSGQASYAILNTAANLVESGMVEYAEPNLISTVVDDILNPSDFLFPMQWHLPLIHCPDAWQVINDNISPDFAFGSPNITIAVVDSGVELGNPDFIGTVSNGNSKSTRSSTFRTWQLATAGRSWHLLRRHGNRAGE